MKVNEFSHRPGLPVSKVRYYDRYGLYESGNLAANNYRDLTERDALDVYHAHMLRSLDMSMKESVKAIREYSLDQLNDWLKEHIARQEEEIRLAQLRLSRLQQLQHYYTGIPSNMGKVFLNHYERSYSICTFGSCSRNDEDTLKAAAVWAEHMPFTYVAITIPEESLSGNRDQLTVGIGLGILEANLEKGGLPVSDCLECFSAGECLSMLLEKEDIFALTREDIRPLFDTAEALGLRITGGATGRILLKYNHDGKNCFCFSLRAHVKPKMM